ncbi:hypothetical protein PIB30_007546 [Stylosanthes scabra]|uniref:Rhomboid-like protein n=1 Tax=Stylosanthes scabra TaxID=79078 RepID=A0ABU6T4G7_9FABA|nr:hypothetical protein [Stylosanthes scabra]
MGKKASDLEAGRHWHPPPPEQWLSWLVPVIFISNIGMFVYTMYRNDCPDYLNKDSCFLSEYLGRFSFQPLRENPLLGPTTRTYVLIITSSSSSFNYSSFKSLSPISMHPASAI